MYSVSISDSRVSESVFKAFQELVKNGRGKEEHRED